MVLFKTWPSVSTPVMFGGGITIENGAFDDSEFTTKSPSSIQRRYHFGSTELGSYLLGSSAIAINHPKAQRVCKWPGCGMQQVPPLPWSRERTEVRDRTHTAQIQPSPYPLPLEWRGDT